MSDNEQQDDRLQEQREEKHAIAPFW